MNTSPQHDLIACNLYFVGIKGTGMAALAELVRSRGGRVCGSDVAERFYTDELLRSAGIECFEGFDAARIGPQYDMVVHSAAYDPAEHPELRRARELGLPVIRYTDALGLLSAGLPSAGVSGVHGKTTTTALAGAVVKACALPGTVLAGSAVSVFDGRSTLSRGWDFFVAETCEYRRHFLAFHPRWIVLTSVEMDHQDYFRDFADIRAAFVEYGLRLERGGALIYCADEPGASSAAAGILDERPDVRAVPYGRMPGDRRLDARFRITDEAVGEGRSSFRLGGFSQGFELRVPGAHTVANAAAALALTTVVSEDLYGRLPDASAAAAGLAAFRGSKRRSEIYGEAGGVVFADDYAHHPTAIRTTLEGLRAFFPRRRLVVDFMPHTYSRTKAMLEDFAAALAAADLVYLHGIYASAREKDDGSVNGRSLYRAAALRHSRVRYTERPEEALGELAAELGAGDLFITLGAGDNWKLSAALYKRFAAGDAR